MFLSCNKPCIKEKGQASNNRFSVKDPVVIMENDLTNKVQQQPFLSNFLKVKCEGVFNKHSKIQNAILIQDTGALILI